MHVTLLGGGFGRKSKPDFAIEAALLSKEWAARRSRCSGRARTTSGTATTTPSRSSASRPALDADGKVVAWRHRSVRAEHRVDSSRPIRSTRGHRAGHGAGRHCRSTSRTSALENGEAEAHARIGWFRSVNNVPHAFAIQSFVAEMAHAARPRPEGLSAGADRPGARSSIRRKSMSDALWNYGEPIEIYPDRHRPPAPRASSWSRRRPAGASNCRRARPRHRRAPQLRHLRRDGGRTWRSATTARSRSRASTWRSTAATSSIPTASARRSRARPSWA